MAWRSCFSYSSALPVPKCHAVERFVRDGHGQTCLLAQRQIQIAQQCAAPGQHNAPVHDISGQIRRCRLQRGHHRLANLLHGFGQGLGNLRLIDLGFFWHTIEQIAPTDFHRGAAPVVWHTCGADRGLDALGGGFTHQQILLTAQIIDDRLIHAVAPHPDRAGIDDITKA